MSGKRDRFVPFPWEIVSAGGVVWGWEPAEWLPMGRIKDVGQLANGAFDVLASHMEIMEYDSPYFYDEENGSKQKTLLHGGYVQIV